MGKSTVTCNETLDAILRAVDPAWRSGVSRYVALHTAALDASSAQNTSEATYTSYARITVTAATGFSAGSSATSSNTGLLQFPEATGGADTVTYISIGTALSGAGQVLYFGALDSSRSISNGIQPQFAIGALDITEA